MRRNVAIALTLFLAANVSAMANAVGAKLGDVLTINEDIQDAPNPFSNGAAVQSLPSIDLATGKFIPGAMRVQVTVHATFELE